ncbi:AAA family ATPase [Arenimonas sp.]|uniref:AAA family ATPase n=1 Tax=Arenimonas sp. TaxID=1872635 RepID=UPI0039E57E61
MADTPCIHVLAGTNGAGKSSVAGSMFREQGSEYFNPDEAARRILKLNPKLSIAEANSLAWHQGRRLLERAIKERLHFNFETTLGGHTITHLLEQALQQGIEVRIWYVGLSNVDTHLSRVKARVKKGGHDIPEKDVRHRFNQSRLNLIRLLPLLTELRVYDNSFEADPHAGKTPAPKLVLHTLRGKVVGPKRLASTPDWAKPIVAAALSK